MSADLAKISPLRRSKKIEGDRPAQAKRSLMPGWPTAITEIPRAIHMPRFRRPSLALIVGILVGAAVLSAGWLWLRDSSLVAVEQVQVSGASGLGAAAVRSSLISEAQQMTTLNVNKAALDDAVARFPLVKSLAVSTGFPHSMTIVVHERKPIGALVALGGTVAVADDGVILRGIPTAGLPTVEVSRISGGERVTQSTAAAEVRLLAGAPERLRPDIAQVASGPAGFVVTLRSGPELRFGDDERMKAKWVAASRVLRDPLAAGATYIDVSIP
ncbi:MAG: FtsQ-type POTRA domain-containing protein, partial [Actinobacteria bacterium]|nr:FtsQ-type POTRA domain-containing protein [Actinomycetota bacterium]